MGLSDKKSVPKIVFATFVALLVVVLVVFGVFAWQQGYQDQVLIDSVEDEVAVIPTDEPNAQVGDERERMMREGEQDATSTPLTADERQSMMEADIAEDTTVEADGTTSPGLSSEERRQMMVED